MKKIIAISLLLSTALTMYSQELSPIRLLPPQLDKGKSLMQSLVDRHSTREFSDKELSLQDISNLLWAANGVNRSDLKKRTAPSAMNWQEIDIFVFLKNGVYRYDAFGMELIPVVTGDHRRDAGTQAFVAEAPLNLVLVADYSKMGRASDADKPAYASADAAFVGENVYLFCSAFNMNCVLRASIDKEKLSGLLKLNPEQKPVFGISAGFPK